MADLKGFVLSFLFCLLLKCAPSLQAESKVFVADYSGRAIFMADFSSDSLDSLTFDALPFDSVAQPRGVDYDPDTRMVYWTEYYGSIRRANINGTMQSVIINRTSAAKPYYLALDTSRGKVFWTDITLDRIMSANLDGSSQQILINTDINNPHAIIIHKGEGVMFWTSHNNPSRIERANLDGGDRYVIVNSSLTFPYGLAFNADCSRVYWCDSYTDEIESVDLWGNDRMVHLATSSIGPWDLAVFDDTIIWTDRDVGAIGATLTNSSSGYSFYYHNTFQNPHGIHVYREEMSTTTEVYNPTTDQANPEPTTEDNRTPQPTWWWWNTDQPTTEDNRTPQPTRWWWNTDQPSTEDNRTPQPTRWWWNTVQPTTEDNRTPQPTRWWWNTDQPTTEDKRTPRPTWWWSTIQPTTTGWWDTTGDMPFVGEENVTLVVGVTQTISSPNYPSNYPNNVRYHWYITAPSGNDVLVQFLDFDLEGCCDYLTIGIGESPSSPGSVQLAKLSGSSLPSDMRLDSSKSWLRFTTDYSVTKRGFQLQLSLINSTTEPVTDDPWVPLTTWWWNNDPTTTESTTTGWWWWTTSYPGTTDTPRQPNETAESMVFVADYTADATIYMADFSSDSLGSLTFDALPFSSVRYPMGIDYDPDTRMVYWSESIGSIRRANIDGTMQSVIVDSSVARNPYFIALDTSRGTVFWTDNYHDRIMSANLDGSSQQILINTDIDIPFGIIIHKREGVMFWTDFGYDRIERANLDGGDRYVIVNSGLSDPRGLAFNADSSRVYWCDSRTLKIESVDLWGNDRMVHLATSSGGFWDLAVVDDSIMWTDYSYDAIGVTLTSSSSGYSFYYHDTFQEPRGIHVYRDEMPTTTEVYEPTTDQINTVRLVNGNEAHEGRVEVFYSGSWGTVCDDYWNINDARVVCRSLGYQDALSAPIQAHFGQGSGPIWMDDVQCSGNEAHIFDCPHHGFENHDCNHGEDASVVCLPGHADLTCDSVSMTLIMDRTLLEISDDARDVHFEDESCVGYDHDSQHVAITTMYDRCGTTKKQDDDYIIFTNMVTFYKPRPENGTNELITREHYLHIPVTCYLERTQVLEESFLPKGDLYVPGEEGYGEFSLNLDRYTNSGFYQPVNDSGEVMLGTPLYFGVRLTSVTNITLLIESCWATSSPDPRDNHRYDIIENGCAVDSTTVIYNWASSTFKRFSIDAFTFIGDYDKVYVHCSILICDNNDSGSRCAQGCLARARRSLQPTGSRSKPHTITIGPLSDAQRSQRAMLIGSIDDVPESHDPLMIVAVSALCVLIALTVIMALMMVRMRRRRPELTGYRRVGVTEQDY